jgi:hypothetical protein
MLAIAGYHKAEDLAVIPEYLAGLELGYHFRLGHTTMHGEETVVFAVSDPGPSDPRGDERIGTSHESAGAGAT